jgi:predicted exporter
VRPQTPKQLFLAGWIASVISGTTIALVNGASAPLLVAFGLVLLSGVALAFDWDE